MIGISLIAEISRGYLEISTYVGIGFWLSNIALVIAAGEVGHLDKIFYLEQAAANDWRSGVFVFGSDIPKNPLRDLITSGKALRLAHLNRPSKRLKA